MSYDSLSTLIIIRFTIALIVLVTSILPPATALSQNRSTRQQSLAALSPHLQKQIAQSDEPISFLIVMNDQLDPYQMLRNQDVQAASKQTKAHMLYQQLTRHALRSQTPIRQWLDSQGIAYRPFYIVNMIEVTGDATLIDKLRRRGDIRRLVANPMVTNSLSVQEADNKYDWLQVVDTKNAEFSTSLPYGITYTNAPDVWAMGYRGQGIVLASQDTGVEWEHPVLKSRYRGWIQGSNTIVNHTYHWFDAWDVTGRPSRCSTTDAQIPCDDNGHGTHTVGTMLGDDTANSGDILGMAPEAQWIGCRNMDNGDGTPASYTACFQFFLAPYPQNGNPFTDGRPDLAPHIINNSWGCPPSEGCDTASLRQVVETVRAAGQFVVSSAGNDGPGCGSVQDPIALHDATFSIGAHDRNGIIASFSSRGPVTADGSNRAKPDLAAPGVNVYSAWIRESSYNGYRSASGTSMAAPHVAGASALLWSATPALIGQIDLTEQILLKSATPVLANQCNGLTEAVSPNFVYGYGRLNILAAVQMAQNPATAAITVQDCDGTPLKGAQVRITDNKTGYTYTQLTDATGMSNLQTIYATSDPEIYTLSAAAGAAQFTNVSLPLTSSGNHAAQLQATACTQPATITVQVLTLGGEPLVNASVVITDEETQNTYSAMTGLDGQAEFNAILSGNYRWQVVSNGANFAENQTIVVSPSDSRTITLQEQFFLYLPIGQVQ